MVPKCRPKICGRRNSVCCKGFDRAAVARQIVHDYLYKLSLFYMILSCKNIVIIKFNSHDICVSSMTVWNNDCISANNKRIYVS